MTMRDLDAARSGALWWRWLTWVTAGECLGFAVPALAGASLVDAPVAIFVLALLAAGATEGAILGGAQVAVLRRALPALRSRAWVGRTTLAALVAWLIGLLPVYADRLPDWPLAVVVPLATGASVVLLLSIGVAQWTVLRTTLIARAWLWVPITAVSWAVGLGAFAGVTSPLWQSGQPVALVAAIGVLGGFVMAVCMAAVTGTGVVWLLRQDVVRPVR